MVNYKSTNVDWKEDYRYANKELHLTRKELQYQQVFAQAAFELYDDQTQVNHSIMILKGIHVDLLSEYLRWKAKNPEKDQPQSKERLDLLAKHLDVISKIQADNYALKWNQGKMRQEIWQLMEENKNLKHQLYLNTLNNNDLPEPNL